MLNVSDHWVCDTRQQPFIHILDACLHGKQAGPIGRHQAGNLVLAEGERLDQTKKIAKWICKRKVDREGHRSFVLWPGIVVVPVDRSSGEQLPVTAAATAQRLPSAESPTPSSTCTPAVAQHCRPEKCARPSKCVEGATATAQTRFFNKARRCAKNPV